MTQNQSDQNIEIVFDGRIGEIVHIKQKDGRVFEQYRRAPGCRLIIISPENEILVIREYRHETKKFDLRLPGGKVRDTLAQWREFLHSGQDLIEASILAAINEARQEVGLEVSDLEFVANSVSGATVVWDLHYFRTKTYTELAQGQNLEVGEQIEKVWMSAAEIKEAVKNGEMQEWRSVGVLLGLVLPSL